MAEKQQIVPEAGRDEAYLVGWHNGQVELLQCLSGIILNKGLEFKERAASRLERDLSVAERTAMCALEKALETCDSFYNCCERDRAKVTLDRLGPYERLYYKMMTGPKFDGDGFEVGSVPQIESSSIEDAQIFECAEVAQSDVASEVPFLPHRRFLALARFVCPVRPLDAGVRWKGIRTRRRVWVRAAA